MWGWTDDGLGDFLEARELPAAVGQEERALREMNQKFVIPPRDDVETTDRLHCSALGSEFSPARVGTDRPDVDVGTLLDRWQHECLSGILAMLESTNNQLPHPEPLAKGFGLRV